MLFCANYTKKSGQQEECFAFAS
ncbi:uncharacterized protein METZ01_LOCUS88134 [marine metagenome]|uniref:Uncharacterized protein n=1 Tax=marine metagenome TaxID=408172 RepID=A0A381V4G8_9ZZZZ